ncbi:MAG: O-antigen ligase family protein [Actinobacteria bacterium]|nr:O-antigen ligase family protein [Actinomycetota bacterium]
MNVNKVGSTKSIFWTIQYFLNYIVGFLFFFIVINTFKNLKEILTAVIILLSSTMISVFIGFYQYFFNPLFGNISFWLEMNRINATFTDPNSLGTYSLMIFPLFVCLIFFSRKWFIKLIVGLLSISFLINMFFSGSRTAFIGLLTSSAIFIIIGLWKAIEKLNMRFKKPARYKKVLLWLFTVVILVVLLLSILNFLPAISKEVAPSNVLLGRINLALDKLNTAFKNKEWEAISMISKDREILWEQAVYMFRDHPISGVGVGAYVIELPNYYIKSGMADYRNSLVDYCGNYYLQFLSELGLPGLLLILFIFFIIIKKAFIYFKSQNYINGLEGYNWLTAGLFISFTSMIIALIFGPHTNFNEIQFTFWLIIGLMLSSIMIKENRRKDLTIHDINKGKFGFTCKISLSILILVFTISTAVGSFTNLSINIKQNLYGYTNRWGYYDYQEELINDSSYRGFRQLTTIASDIVEKKGQVMFFSIKARYPDVYKDDIYIRFYIDNSIVKIVRLKDDNWHYIELSIPHTERDKIAFTVCTSRSLIPGDWNVPKDSKDPGIMITDINFKNN